uniref:C-type lectin domain-containing protein n=1 Tax=Naja naja TaxID=35670 RepID=A0A8C6VTT9_NAJNA
VENLVSWWTWLVLFVYLNGQAVGYTNWKSSEPNNLDNEDCVVLLTDSLWNDIDCDHQTLIICEL